MTKKTGKKPSSHCPLCGGTGLIKDQTEGRISAGKGYVHCPQCGGRFSIQDRTGRSVEFSVEGTKAEEVQSVLSSAYRQIADSQTKPQAREKRMAADVAVATALPMELKAFLRYGGPWARVESARESIRTYYQYTTGNGVSVIAVSASGMGQLNAALVARDIIAEWGPKKLVLVGIAAGLGDEVHLGDVVVSDQIVDYELGKITPAGATPRWSVYRSDALLREKLLNFDPAEWISQVTTQRPEGDKAIVPKVHCGVVLSGNKVIADEETAGALRSVWTRAAAIEMEAAGIAAALYQTPDAPSFIMIKGICDQADSRKDDKWQEYAADVSGAFAMSFILKALKPLDVSRMPGEKEPEIPAPGLDFRALRLALSAAFDLRELKILASDLQVDWDNIAGQIKDEKIVEFIWYMKRRNRLNQLIDVVKQERSDLLDAYSSP